MNLNTDKQFRPRPIDINTPLPIITDEDVLNEIELESSHYTAIQPNKKRKVVSLIMAMLSLYTTKHNATKRLHFHEDKSSQTDTDARALCRLLFCRSFSSLIISCSPQNELLDEDDLDVPVVVDGSKLSIPIPAFR